MEAVEFENDDMLRLLTDALRRGPGSPEWRDALDKLRTGASPDVSEHQLLLLARENIELGKSYREVRAGPGFTRDLMEKIDAESAQVAPMKLAPVVAVVSGLGILLGVGWIAFKLWGTPPDDHRALTETLFVQSVRQLTFDGAVPADLKWMDRSAPVDSAKGLRLSGDAKVARTASAVLSTPLDAGPGVCIEASVVASPDLARQSLEIVVSDAISPATSAPDTTRAPESTSAPESTRAEPAALTTFVAPGQIKVWPTGSSASAGGFSGQANLRIRLNDRVALVESNGQVIFTGPHRLQPGQVKQIILRLYSQDDPTGEIAIKSLTILKP